MVRNTAISGLDSFLLSTNVTSFSTKISLSFYFFKFCVQDLHLVLALDTGKMVLIMCLILVHLEMASQMIHK